MTREAQWVVWNLFLAIIPVAAAYNISMLSTGRRKRIPLLLSIVLGFVWLAFLPNTCYLLTEWRHYLFALDRSDLYIRSGLDANRTLILMAYTVFYFLYSGIGMLLFAMAIRPVAGLAKRKGMRLWVWAMPFFLLMSLGVYLGLVLRFNSWQLVTQPMPIFEAIGDLAHRPKLSAFIVAFGGFLWLAYLALDVWIDGMVHRLKGPNSPPCGSC